MLVGPRVALVQLHAIQALHIDRASSKDISASATSSEPGKHHAIRLPTWWERQPHSVTGFDGRSGLRMGLSTIRYSPELSRRQLQRRRRQEGPEKRQAAAAAAGGDGLGCRPTCAARHAWQPTMQEMSCVTVIHSILSTQ